MAHRYKASKTNHSVHQKMVTPLLKRFASQVDPVKYFPHWFSTRNISLGIFLYLFFGPEILTAQVRIILKNDSIITAEVWRQEASMIYIEQPENISTAIEISSIKRMIYPNGEFTDYEYAGARKILLKSYQQPKMETPYYLYHVSDSSIDVKTPSYSTLGFDIKHLPVSEIQFIRLKNVSVGRTMLAGAGLGFLVGGIAGLFAGGDPGCSRGSGPSLCFTPTEAALGGGLVFGLGGLLGGGIAVAIKRSTSIVWINGDAQRLRKNKLRLSKYVLKP